MRHLLALALPLVLASLAACGDKGGTPAAPVAPTAPVAVFAFTPASLTATLHTGTASTLLVTALPQTTLVDGQVFVRIDDPADVLQPTITLQTNPDGSYALGLRTQPALPVGPAAGTLQVHLCRDSACSTEYPGSPAALPYAFDVQPAPAVLTAITEALAVTQLQGETAEVTLKYKVDSAGVTGYSLLVTATHSGDVVFAKPMSSTDAAGVHTDTLRTPATLPAGVHEGYVRVSLCQNSACSSHYPGSPLLIPYTVTVIGSTNLTPLAALAGAPDWQTYQGNAGHTGHVPVTLDPAAFSPRWSWILPDTGVTLSPVATADDQVYVTASGYFTTDTKLYALDEAAGGKAWERSFGSLYALNPPAAMPGKVFIASSKGTATSAYMWGLSAADGAALFKTPIAAQWEDYLAPTIRDGKVYTNGGAYGGLYCFNISDGTQAWFNANLAQYDSWTPAVDSLYAYAYVGYQFAVINVSDGSLAFQLSDPDFNWNGYDMEAAPVLGSNGHVILVNGPGKANKLRSYDIAGQALAWSVSGAFASNPVLANGVIYVTNAVPFRLEARSEADGSLLWSWTPPSASTTSFVGNVVATDNLVFVSTNTGTTAISLATHQPVWNHAKSGALAISANGILYISTPTQLYAVNLH